MRSLPRSERARRRRPSGGSASWHANDCSAKGSCRAPRRHPAGSLTAIAGAHLHQQTGERPAAASFFSAVDARIRGLAAPLPAECTTSAIDAVIPVLLHSDAARRVCARKSLPAKAPAGRTHGGESAEIHSQPSEFMNYPLLVISLIAIIRSRIFGVCGSSPESQPDRSQANPQRATIRRRKESPWPPSLAA